MTEKEYEKYVLKVIQHHRKYGDEGLFGNWIPLNLEEYERAKKWFIEEFGFDPETEPETADWVADMKKFIRVRRKNEK
ncbi:MAG: hypothetical protein H0Z24_00845 [Thermosipho sp. (in: Bacteria)]|nr:hypothetical protein [Thermosipho sp. (in: thermotogales)]